MIFGAALTSLVLTATLHAAVPPPPPLDLDGEWEFETDPDRVRDQWPQWESLSSLKMRCSECN
jgi:hypothetical protein